MSPIDSPHASEIRAPVAYSSSSRARSRSAIGSSPDDGVEQRRHLGLGQRLGQPGRHPHALEVDGRVVGPLALGDEVAVQRAHRGQLAGDAATAAAPLARRSATKSTSVAVSTPPMSVAVGAAATRV